MVVRRRFVLRLPAANTQCTLVSQTSSFHTLKKEAQLQHVQVIIRMIKLTDETKNLMNFLSHSKVFKLPQSNPVKQTFVKITKRILKL